MNKGFVCCNWSEADGLMSLQVEQRGLCTYMGNVAEGLNKETVIDRVHLAGRKEQTKRLKQTVAPTD